MLAVMAMITIAIFTILKTILTIARGIDNNSGNDNDNKKDNGNGKESSNGSNNDSSNDDNNK